jgi:hypothetical protein
VQTTQVMKALVVDRYRAVFIDLEVTSLGEGKGAEPQPGGQLRISPFLPLFAGRTSDGKVNEQLFVGKFEAALRYIQQVDGAVQSL